MASRLPKTFYVENLGCFRNQVDAEYLIAGMKAEGYQAVTDASEAATIVVNTCGFIESAKKESIDTFFDFKGAHPGAKVVLAGCLAQRYGDGLMEMLPEADGIFGNKAPEQLPKMMAAVEAGEKPTFFPAELTTSPRRNNFLSHKRSAFLKIAEGCIHHCTFCAIPKIRGALVSRTISDVVEEFKDLLSKGIFEVNLIAQDLASFGKEQGKSKTVELLAEMLKVPGDYWIRPFYIHPDTFPEGLIELMQADSRLLPYFDLPFQHADKTILTKMARYGDKETYLALIERIRTALPHAVIRSTFLVGFPGEGSAEYNQLLDFQALARLDWLGTFEYSREEQTAAFRRQTDEEFEKGKATAKRRRTTLETRQNPITAQRLDLMIGKTLDVLLEEQVEGSNLWLGRTYAQAPEVDGLVVLHAPPTGPLTPGEADNSPALLMAGSVVKANITARNGVDLEAVLL